MDSIKEASHGERIHAEKAIAGRKGFYPWVAGAKRLRASCPIYTDHGDCGGGGDEPVHK